MPALTPLSLTSSSAYYNDVGKPTDGNIVKTDVQNLITRVNLVTNSAVELAGIKTFTSLPLIPTTTPTADAEAVSWAVLNKFVPTGAWFPYFGASLPAALLGIYVILSGGTIGSSSSGASLLADDAAEDLFTLLWDNDTGGTLTVSSGRGASAAADWAANKTITVPDMRGNAMVVLDNLGGSARSLLTSSSTNGANSTVLGGQGGAQTHTLTSAQMPSHTHSFTAAVNAINQGFGGGNAITASSGASTTGSAGSG